MEDIIETISDKSIQWILNNYNHIYVEYSESVAITRNKVPSLLRRNGLWISYNTGKDIVTEWYKGKNTDITAYNQWTDDANWAKFEPLADGKVTYQHLSYALKQLMGKGNNITNFPDEEDITTDGTVLSFKDREYDTNNFSGLGKIILRKNIVLDNGAYKNVLTQDMINKPNTIYEIRYDFDLNGKEITIPEGCVLDFQGGSLSNGILIGNNTCIKADAVKIFSNIRKKKTWNIDYIYLEWFGAIGDGIKDSTKEIQEAFDFADSGIINITNYDESAQYSLENTIFFYIKAKGGTYNINSTIKIPIKVNIDFNYSTIIPAIDGDYYEYRDWKYIFINNVNDNGTFIRNYISNDGVIKNLKVGKARYYINKLGVLLTGAPIQMYNVSTTNLYPIYSTLLYTGGCYLDGIIIDNVKMVAEVETDSLPENPPLGYIVDKRSYGDYIKFTNIVGTQNRKNIKAVKLEHTHGGEISNSVQCSLYCVDCTAINFHSNHLEEYSNLIIYSSEVNINSCFFWSQENSLIVIGSQEGTDIDIPYNRSSVTINNCCIQVRRDRPITNNTSDIAIYTKSGSTCAFNNVKRLISGRTSIGYERTGFLYKDVSNNKIYANTLQQGILKPVDGKISEIGTLNEINLDINDYTIEAITEKSNFSTLKSGIYSYDFYIIANDDLKIRKKISFDINVNEGERVVVKINKKLPFGAKFYINRKFEDIKMMANLPISYTSILSDCGNDINGILWSSGNINKAQGIIGNSAVILGKNNNYTIFNADSGYFPE